MATWKEKTLKLIATMGLALIMLSGTGLTNTRTENLDNGFGKVLGNNFGIYIAEAGTYIQSEKTLEVGPGVSYRKAYATSDGAPQAINLLNLDMTNEFLKLRSSAPNDRPAGLETVSSQARRQTKPGEAVIAAVNGDFFYLSDPAGLPIGMQIRDGEILSGPSNQPVFGVTKSGQPFIDTITMHAQAQTVGEKVYSRAIDAVNKRRLNNLLVLFTPTNGATTKTNNLGTELVISGLEMPIRPNQTYIGTVVEKRVANGNSTIPIDGVVLSGHGTAENFLKGFQPGQQINFSVNLDKVDVEQAIGGITRPVINGQLAPASVFASLDTGLSRQPRTAVGIKGNQVVIVTVDGRQPGISAGMTLAELGQLMLDLGMEQVINFDGGGSTTFTVRQPGDSLISLANRPSDGKERLVSNSLQVVNTAPQGELAHLMVMPSIGKIFSQSRQQFSLKGIDQYINPIDISGKEVQWTVDEGLGSIDQQGMFTAGSNAAAGKVTANIDGVTVSTQINVVSKVTRIALTPNPLIVLPGNTATLMVSAFDESSHPVIINNGGINWTESGGTGTIDPTGLYTAGAKVKEGKITASVGDQTATVKVYTGRPPLIIEDFEELSDWTASQLKATATLAKTTGQPHSQEGFSSGKLSYSFQRNLTGTAAAYMLRKSRLQLEGRPVRLGVWVYGDAKGHWLRGIYYDGAGKKNYLDFAPQTGVNWTGWKYVTAEIPSSSPLPLSLESIYVAEDRMAKKDQGVLCFDELTAEYTTQTAGMIPAISVRIPTIDNNTTTIEVPVEQNYQSTNGKYLVVLDLAQLTTSPYDQNKVSLYKLLDDGTRRIQRTVFVSAENKIKALVDGLGEFELAENSPSFADISELSRFGWAKRDIEIMAAKEIVNGRGNSLFVPEDQVTRAEFLAMLVRAMVLKANPTSQVTFSDVKSGAWYEDCVKAAVLGNLTKGYSNGTFQPDKRISRLEMTILLSRAAKLNGSIVQVDTGVLGNYRDGKDVPAWATQELSFAIQQGLIQGKEKDRLAFNDFGNRAEATVLVKRYFDIYGIPKL